MAASPAKLVRYLRRLARAPAHAHDADAALLQRFLLLGARSGGLLLHPLLLKAIPTAPAAGRMGSQGRPSFELDRWPESANNAELKPMSTSQLADVDIEKAQQIWTEYQRQHDVSGRKGEAAGIDPVTGRVWFGQRALDIAEQMRGEGIDRPFYCIRVGRDYYLRKGGPGSGVRLKVSQSFCFRLPRKCGQV